jgi:hypothetical protein
MIVEEGGSVALDKERCETGQNVEFFTDLNIY